MKVFRFKFGITTVIMVVKRGITLYLTKKIIKRLRILFLEFHHVWVLEKRD